MEYILRRDGRHTTSVGDLKQTPTLDLKLMKQFEDGHRIKHYLQPNELNQTEQLPPKPSSRNKYSTVTKNKTQQHAIEDIKEIYRKYKKI